MIRLPAGLFLRNLVMSVSKLRRCISGGKQSFKNYAQRALPWPLGLPALAVSRGCSSTATPLKG